MTAPPAPTDTPTTNLRVTSVGSCRVVGPLRRAAAGGEFVLNQTGVYGYCHSSAEAVQQVQVLRGERVLPAHLLPVVAPRLAGGARDHTPHVPSQLYFVELSSAKELRIDGVHVQLNYFTRHLREFFADPDRARAYWRTVRAGDPRALRALVADDPVAAQQTAADRYLLASLTMRLTTAAQMAADIRAIQARLPNVLFVTHFNAADENGDPVPARADFIALARTALKDTGAIYFDPSDYVEAYGQADAIDSHQGSLSHYTGTFEAFLARNWMTRYIQPLADGLHESQARARHRAAPDELIFA